MECFRVGMKLIYVQMSSSGNTALMRSREISDIEAVNCGTVEVIAFTIFAPAKLSECQRRGTNMSLVSIKVRRKDKRR